jgi:hypothetical protein
LTSSKKKKNNLTLLLCFLSFAQKTGRFRNFVSLSVDKLRLSIKSKEKPVDKLSLFRSLNFILYFY